MCFKKGGVYEGGGHRFNPDHWLIMEKINLPGLSTKESTPKASIVVESGYEEFIPNEFMVDPFAYFDVAGKNIKPGAPEYDEGGRIKEDPGAVRTFPNWTNLDGKTIEVVGKKINAGKSKVGRSGNPFYEYEIMKVVKQMGFPTAECIARASLGDQFLFVMEKVKGLNWFEAKNLPWDEMGFSRKDTEKLEQEAIDKMGLLAKKFDEVGIVRKWKISDMIFDIDFDNKTIRSITPVDWERTKIIER